MASGPHPAGEVVICGPGESFRWAVHDHPHHLAKWHRHPEYELHLIQATSGQMMIGDHVGPFEPGSLVLTGPNLPHNWVSAIGPGERVCDRDMLVQFGQGFADTLSQGFAELAEVGALIAESAFGVEFIGETARRGARKLCEIGPAAGPRRLILFLDMMAELSADPAGRRTLSRGAPSLGLHSVTSRRLERVIAFLGENYQRDLGLAEAAEVCNMEATAFSRFFKHQTGHNFSFYVNQLRVQHACTLLSGSDLPITKICYDAGFNNTANFNRQFFAVCRQTPSAYRRDAHQIRRNAPSPERAPEDASLPRKFASSS
ncbi:MULTISPECIES: helix-turn-helix domain-containing protein [unclassified Aureimonas]|uniref:helix-turn-helix domain-containing protein n=1 Tax=unclassified Aureimonas TaxID=2615206 RepID=UPI0009EB72B9|nr:MULTISPECIES: AraC family transcriptional regulator [unclassified Aureimonas]